MMTVDQILQSHGYRDGSEVERLLLALKDLARTRAELAIYKIVMPVALQPYVDQGIRDLVDA